MGPGFSDESSQISKVRLQNFEPHKLPLWRATHCNTTGYRAMSRIATADKPKPKTARKFVEPKRTAKPLVRVQEEDHDDNAEVSDIDMDSNEDEDEDSEGDHQEDQDSEPEPITAAELELERLVFGDSSAFRENLKGFKGDDSGRRGDLGDLGDGEEEGEEGMTGLERVGDDAVSSLSLISEGREGVLERVFY